MLIAHIAALPAERDSFRQELSSIEKDRPNGRVFYAEFPEAWSRIPFPGGRVLLHAPKYVQDQILGAPEKLCSENWLTHLHSIDGPYLVVRMEGDSIEISRSLYRGLEVFYTRIADHLAFSTSLPLLLRLKQDRGWTLDPDYCQRFILDRPAFSGATAISDVRSICLGQSVRSDLSSISTIGVQMPREQSSGPIEILTTKLSTLSRSFSSVSLSFSGGLDSSALLHCLSKAGVDFEAIHAVSPLPYADSERHEAEKVAAAYSRELSIVQMIESEGLGFAPSMLEQPQYASPFDVDIFRAACTERPQGPALPPTNALMVTGHGGDHVFLQNPSWKVGFDRVRKFDVSGFFMDVKRRCTLKKTNFYAGLWQNIRLLLGRHADSRGLHLPTWLPGRARTLAADDHYLLAGMDPRTAKFEHVRSILLGLSTIELHSPDNNSTLHPLLLPDVVGTVLYRPVRELFNAQHDRVYFRRDFHDSAGHDFAWRKSKRSSSASLFKYFRDNQDPLLEWLADGIVARQLMLDADELRKSLMMNGQVYLDDDFPALINLIQLEGFVQSLRRHSQ
ncbi:hypothetical protein [Achromobacter spanius]|uniref:Asparagine synthetase domain-containing protein n=1 Tax=Achromobacter spanius TaxID=217203 RepID=A0A2S0IFM3_9BURK|nr:hypothetical protein [Achromobacter spanius]AVJ30768.1 hypothetical protein CLM73_28685 [Achromobacter spanius]